MSASRHEHFGEGAGTKLQHIAVVMDGNGRWAELRGLPRSAGHRAGVRAARDIVEACGHRGVPVLTLFAFSSENWHRPRAEVRLLMGLFVEALQREVQDLHRNNVRLRFIGDLSMLAQRLRREIASSEALTATNTGLQLRIAVSYGGRWDIVQAAQHLATMARSGDIDPADIDETRFSEQLCTAGVPDPDLFIRTGGETRISNFLLWNLAYSEMYFSDKLWPDFDAGSLDEALDLYFARERRFGRTGQQLP